MLWSKSRQIIYKRNNNRKKRNNRIPTDSGNIDGLNKFKLENIKLGKENLSAAFENVNKDNFDNISK